MKKFLIFLSFLLVAAYTINAANILIWHFDFDNLDTYTDPEAGKEIGPDYWIKESLTANNYVYDYHKDLSLPTDIISYDVVLVTLGYYTCWGDNQIVGQADLTKLANFLEQGKGLYVEGNDFGFNNSSSNLYKMFGCNFLGSGDIIDSLIGEDGSIVEGKSYTSIGGPSIGGGINCYIDDISADEGTLIFKCDRNKGHGVTYEGQNDSYRALHTSFCFNAVRGADARNELMKIYMDYLLPNSPIIEEQYQPFVINKIFTSSDVRDGRLSFTLANSARIKIDFYNIAGRFMAQLINDEFNKGTYQINLDFKDSGKMLSSGRYILRFDANGEVVNQLINLK